jgi:predicted transcriptional regulator
MTAALKAVLEQAKRLSREERAELRDALDALDDNAPQPPPLTHDERNRQIAEGLAQIARGEVIDEDEMFAELDRQ